MEKKKHDIPNDVLPEQIVEDVDGNMHIIPAEWLETDRSDRDNPLLENELGVENMEKDLPCTDVEDYDSLEESPE